MTWGRFILGSLLSGAVLFAVGVAFHYITPLMAPWLEAEYRNQSLFRPWSGWTHYYMLAHPWLFGTMFTGIFLGTQATVGAANLGGAQDGLRYGIAVFAVGSLPIYALNLASFQVSAGVVAAWVVQSFCQYLLAGLGLGWYCPRVRAL